MIWVERRKRQNTDMKVRSADLFQVWEKINLSLRSVGKKGQIHRQIIQPVTDRSI